MRKFGLYRDEDPTGISGTGRVADGVEFTSGKVVLHWLTDVASVGVYDTIKQVEKIHGHNGKTRIVWDEPAVTVFKTLEEAFEWFDTLPPNVAVVITRRASITLNITSPLTSRFNIALTDMRTGHEIAAQQSDNLIELCNNIYQKWRGRQDVAYKRG